MFQVFRPLHGHPGLGGDHAVRLPHAAPYSSLDDQQSPVRKEMRAFPTKRGPVRLHHEYHEQDQATLPGRPKPLRPPREHPPGLQTSATPADVPAGPGGQGTISTGLFHLSKERCYMNDNAFVERLSTLVLFDILVRPKLVGHK